MFKRISATILALVMLIGLLPILPASTTAYAASGTCGDNITWFLGSYGYLTLTGYGEMYDYDTGDNPPPWYSQREEIKMVFFDNTESGITKIGANAFSDCSNITDVFLPPTLESVGRYAFFYCTNLEDISLPASVTGIGIYAFSGCRSLTGVPSENRLKNVTSLGTGAFSDCEGIKEAIIPPSLKKVPEGLYYSCSGITEPLIIPENVTCIGGTAFAHCDSLSIAVLNTGVTEVKSLAFYDCPLLNTVYISNPLTMGYQAFEDCADNITFFIDSTENEFVNNSDIDSENSVFYNAEHYYQRHFPVVFNPNGGSGGDFGAMGTPILLSYPPNNELDIPLIFPPTRASFTFKNWNTKPDGSGTTYDEYDTYIVNAGLNIYAQWEKDIIRLSGSSRNGTAVAISNEVEEAMEYCEAVVLANGWNFADALAGGPLAVALKAPILLITGDDNDAETYAEIERLGVNDIYILGGKGAVSEDVDAKLKKDGYNVERIAGDNRFETAVKIAEKMDSLYSYLYRYSAFYAYSHNYPDALAVSGIAASLGAPILYIDSDGVLDPATEAYIKKVEFSENYIIGGTGAISSAAEDNIKSAGAKAVKRISGATRYETCLEINKQLSKFVYSDVIFVSTGVNFPDALAGSVLAACYQSPMLLVAPDEPLSDAQKKFIIDRTNSNICIFGGKVAVPEAIENKIKDLF